MKKETSKIDEIITLYPDLSDPVKRIIAIKIELNLIASNCLKIKVKDESSLSVMEQNLSKLNDLVKQVEETRVKEKKPFLDKGKAVDDVAKYMTKLSFEAINHLKNEKIAYIKIQEELVKKSIEEESNDPIMSFNNFTVPDFGKIRRPWKYEVVDMDKVPREFLMVDEAKVKEWLNSNKDVLEDGQIIHGIKYFKGLTVTA